MCFLGFWLLGKRILMINLDKYFWPTAESEWIDIFVCILYLYGQWKFAILLFFRINKDINIISNPGCIINLVSRQPQQLLVKWPNKCELWTRPRLHLIDQGIKELGGSRKIHLSSACHTFYPGGQGTLFMQIQRLIDSSNSFKLVNVTISSARHGACIRA